jgi:hypothetical protein
MKNIVQQNYFIVSKLQVIVTITFNHGHAWRVQLKNFQLSQHIFFFFCLDILFTEIWSQQTSCSMKMAMCASVILVLLVILGNTYFVFFFEELLTDFFTSVKRSHMQALERMDTCLRKFSVKAWVMTAVQIGSVSDVWFINYSKATVRLDSTKQRTSMRSIEWLSQWRLSYRTHTG